MQENVLHYSNEELHYSHISGVLAFICSLETKYGISVFHKPEKNQAEKYLCRILARYL